MMLDMQEKHNNDLLAGLLTDMAKKNPESDKICEKCKKPTEGKIPVDCKRCKNHWHYGGNKKFYIQCPECKTSINIRPFLAAAQAAQ